MDDEMAEAMEVFVCFEVDLDYEFDAPRFFDLVREETLAETRDAERWFDTARSYPPSPLIAKLIISKDIKMESTSALSILEDLEYKVPHADATIPQFSTVSGVDRGCTFYSSMLQSRSTIDSKPTIKKPSKRSTLMKPTASQLAKQNRSREVKSTNRFQKQLEARQDQCFEDDYVHQASKRQRLERGHCCKMITRYYEELIKHTIGRIFYGEGMALRETSVLHENLRAKLVQSSPNLPVTGVKQQIDLFHKVPEKNFSDVKTNALVDANNHISRLKLTIPREPELRTARRALYSRAQLRSGDAQCMKEGKAHTTSTFKALPLNRKILDAPSLPLPQRSTPRLPKFKEFNFRTHGRALVHNMSAPSLISDCEIPTAIKETAVRPPCLSSGHQQLQDDGKMADEGRCTPTKFKAQALNRKILASKGDIGIFRSIKREITMPKEFNFSTAKRFQQTPLTELFNKLSLTSDAQQSTSMPKFQLPNHSDVQDSKENLIHIVQQK